MFPPPSIVSKARRFRGLVIPWATRGMVGDVALVEVELLVRLLDEGEDVVLTVQGIQAANLAQQFLGRTKSTQHVTRIPISSQMGYYATLKQILQ